MLLGFSSYIHAVLLSFSRSLQALCVAAIRLTAALTKILQVADAPKTARKTEEEQALKHGVTPPTK